MLSQQEIQQIVAQLKEELTSENPGFVPRAECQINTEHIKARLNTLFLLHLAVLGAVVAFGVM